MSPEFSVSPIVALRGLRDYLHSTDLYTELVTALNAHAIAATSFDLKIKEKIVTQPKIEFYRESVPDLGVSIAAIAKFRTVNSDWVAVVSHGSEVIATRKTYDETLAWSKITRQETQFVLVDVVDYTPIEVVTAAGVFAHKTLFPPQDGERWLLAQIFANRLLGAEELKYFKVDVSRRLGPKLTQSDLIDKTGVFGKMLFILK